MFSSRGRQVGHRAIIATPTEYMQWLMSTYRGRVRVGLRVRLGVGRVADLGSGGGVGLELGTGPCADHGATVRVVACSAWTPLHCRVWWGGRSRPTRPLKQTHVLLINQHRFYIWISTWRILGALGEIQMVEVSLVLISWTAEDTVYMILHFPKPLMSPVAMQKANSSRLQMQHCTARVKKNTMAVI